MVKEFGNVVCRVGRHGQVGRFGLAEPLRLSRGDGVLCRTKRGVERGEVLSVSSGTHDELFDGQLLRRMTREDHLFDDHLRAMGESSYAECQGWLAENQIEAVLLEVEPLLDGRTLYFHFIGQPPDEMSSYLNRMVEIFQDRVQSSRFAQLVDKGCGPDCGTSSSAKCGDSGCSACAIASRCKKPKQESI